MKCFSPLDLSLVGKNVRMPPTTATTNTENADIIRAIMIIPPQKIHRHKDLALLRLIASSGKK